MMTARTMTPSVAPGYVSIKGVKRIWQAILRAWQEAMHQRITRLGLFFTGLLLTVGLAAFVSGNNLLFLLLAALMSALLISGFVSRLSLAGLELDVKLPEHVSAGEPVRAQFVIKNNKVFTPSFSLELSGGPETGMRRTIYIPVAPGRTTVLEWADLLFSRRGVQPQGTFYFSTRFPFGFTYRRAQVRLVDEVLVYPCLKPQSGYENFLSGILGELEGRDRGRGSELYRIRPYEMLESARHVDWRATAHAGSLQVREFAREQDQAVTIFLDLFAPAGDSEAFEASVAGCAYLVWSLHDRGTRLRLRTQRWDRRSPEEVSVYDMLRYLALVEPLFGAKAAPPDDANVAIAITSRATEFMDLGWHTSRVPASGPGAKSPAGR
jgi:uncharacterized protein (DUF58 family)